MVTWDPTTYASYSAERGRPFADLVGRVRATARVVDLGCGPGALTATLAERWPAARVIGVDSSAPMLARARSAGLVGVELGDVREWRPAEPVDVLVTNATLQWVPGHVDLLPRWVEQAIRPGGWFAMQVPGNLDDPLHTLLHDLVTSPDWVSLVGAAEGVRAPVLDPAGYAGVLAEAGCQVDAWETTYLHILDPEGQHGPDAVLGWAMGTALRPVLDLLPDNDIRDDFLDQYAALLRAAYPRRPWGTPLPFRRVFAVARTASS